VFIERGSEWVAISSLVTAAYKAEITLVRDLAILRCFVGQKPKSVLLAMTKEKTASPTPSKYIARKPLGCRLARQALGCMRTAHTSTKERLMPGDTVDRLLPESNVRRVTEALAMTVGTMTW